MLTFEENRSFLKCVKLSFTHFKHSCVILNDFVSPRSGIVDYYLFMSYLTTRESLIGHSGWALPHYTEMGYSSSSF